TVPQDILIKLSEVTRDSPLLVDAILMSVVTVCLHKYSGAHAITIGSPGRFNPKDTNSEPVVIPIVIKLNPEQIIRDFLSAVRQCLIEAYARPVRPIEELINALGLKSIDNQSPLFDIAVILTGFHKTMPEMRNDLTLIFTQGNDGVS